MNKKITKSFFKLRFEFQQFLWRHRNKQHATILDLTDKIGSPCADIAFSWFPGKDSKLEIRMRFSNVVGNESQDFLVTFNHVLSVRYDEETYGSIYGNLPPIPRIPKPSKQQWEGYSYPIAKIQNSVWARQYSGISGASSKPAEHYAFVSLNDTVQVLARPGITSSWLPSENSGQK